MNEARRTSRKFSPLLLIGALLFFTAFANGQDDPPQAGRLSSLSGNVSVQPSGSQEWGDAYPNLPIGPGDRLYTDASSRAEIQIGRTFVRLGPNSDVTLVDASPNQIAFGIGQGAVHVRTDGLWQGQYLSVQTPSGSATVNQPADFRVDVYPDQQAAVFTANSGADYVSGADGFGVNLNSGQAIELVGSNPVYPQWLQPAPFDDLDQWSQQRDQQIARAASYRYMSPEIDGGYDLDQAGDWQPGTEYGDIWFPRVQAGWEPYRNGHWVNRDPWGWVWVEDEPWGYAPFHYGRWVNYHDRWGWIPGPREEHPVWSPALVVFAGGIGGGGLSAWFALGPGEPYRPSYPCSPRYVDRINRSNIAPAPRVVIQKTYVNITNVNVTNITYVNQRNVVAMRQQDFASGRSVAQSGVRIDPREVQRVQVIAKPVVAPPARPIITRPVSRPVPVAVARPVLINSEGQAVAAQAHARPIPPPVRPVTAPRPLPGRQVIAPPANVRMTPTAQRAMQNAPRPNQPNAQQPQRPGPQESQRPNPQQPQQPVAQQEPGRPNPIAPNVPVRPGTSAAQPNPARPNPEQPNSGRTNPEQSRPGQPTRQQQQQPDRPQYQPQPRPGQQPVPPATRPMPNQPLPPANRPMPQQPLPPATRPLPNQPHPDQPRPDQPRPDQPRPDQPRPYQPAPPTQRPLPQQQDRPVQPPQQRPVQPEPVRPPADRPAPAPQPQDRQPNRQPDRPTPPPQQRPAPEPRPMPQQQRPAPEPRSTPQQQGPAPGTRPAPPPHNNERPAPNEKDKDKRPQ